MNFEPEFHPDIIATLGSISKPICPICSNEMKRTNNRNGIVCADIDCRQAHDMLVLSYQWITFTTNRNDNNTDALVYAELNFQDKIIKLTLAPEHKEISIPWFDIDWKQINSLPKKLQLYLKLL